MSLVSRGLGQVFLLLTLSELNSFAQQPGRGGSSSRIEEKTVTGAIRWDAWHGNRSEVGKAVERSLSPKRWHGRLPFFAKVLGEDQVQIDGASQQVMDREIQYARTARLDYWAFLVYDEGNPMNLGLQHYLSSTQRNGLRFCVILGQDNWKTSESAAKQFQRVAELIGRNEYQKVEGDRPLIYILAAESDNDTWGARHGRVALDQLRSVVRTKGGGNPYIVIQYYRAGRANALREELNADAISAYAYQRDDKNAAYGQLAREAEQFWDECRSTGSAVVPIVMTGWDRRPRVERPVFWETQPSQQLNVGIEKYYHEPTAAELSLHLRHALMWVKAHPDAAPARAILIYAWNENDEGGWLVPTLKEGSWRLRAVREGLRTITNQ
jgi:hypothetical protein